MKPLSVRRLAHRVILSTGWARKGYAFASGALGALALPPFDIFPALIIPMTVAVWLIDGAVAEQRGARLSGRLGAAWEAALSGWWLGFGFFLAGLWWLGSAFLVEADQFAWALPLGVIGLPGGLAIFTALGFGLARMFWSTSASRVLALAAALGFSEWLRGAILTGFPWNDFGMALGGNLVLGQTAALVGLHGLTVLAVAMAAAPATLADDGPAGRAPVYAACVVLLGLTAFGAGRLTLGSVSMTPNVRLRIMQPNLAQDAKFRPDAMAEIVDRYLALSDRPTSPRSNGIGDVTHLVWPESPFPVILSRDAESLKKIGAFLPHGATLITGAARQETIEDARGGMGRRFFNSMHVIQWGGEISDTYDKTHLVPFGEYLPLQRLLEKVGIRQFVHIPGGFEAGRRRALLRAPGLPPIAPLICYEAIFSGAATPPRERGADRPGLILNITNDGWFGNTPGPYQHLAQARLRAIEEGLPLVRAANTGVSAIIDPYGRVIGSLPLGREDVLDGLLPEPITPPFFARNPQLAPFGAWLAALLGALLLRPRRRRLT